MSGDSALVGEARIAGDHEQRLEARQRGDDVLDHAVGEILLLGIAAHVLERQHGDGRLVGQSERFDRRWPAAVSVRVPALGWHRRRPVRRLPLHAKRLHRPLDVLEGEAAQIVERRLQPACHGFMDVARDHDAASRRFRLQPRRDVHAIAVEIVAIDDQVAEVQADAEHDGVSRAGPGWPRPWPAGTRWRRQGIDGAGELDQRAVAGQLDQPAAVSRQRRLEALACGAPAGAPACRSRPAPSGGSSRQRRRENRRQFALLTDHGNFPRPAPDRRRLAPARRSSGRAGRRAGAAARAMPQLPPVTATTFPANMLILHPVAATDEPMQKPIRCRRGCPSGARLTERPEGQHHR